MWVLGLFTFAYFKGGEIKPLFTFIDAVQTDTEHMRNILFGGELFRIWGTFLDFFSLAPFQATIFGLSMLALIALLLWITFAAQATLIHIIDGVNRHQPVRIPTSMIEGVRRSGHAFAVNIIGRVFVYAIILALTFPLIAYLFKPALAENGDLTLTAGIFMTLAVIIFIPLMIIANFVINYAVAYTVLYRYSVVNSIRGSIKLLKRHWLESLEWGLVLLLVDLVVVSIALLIIMSTFGSPLLIQAKTSIIINAFGPAIGAIIFGVISLFLFGVFGWLGAFHQTVWILLFEHFTLQAPARVISLIHRVFTAVFGMFQKQVTPKRDVDD